MITKTNFKKMKKVGIAVWGKSNQKFNNGKKSMTFTVYDAEPDEVLKVIEKAIEQAR
jgi:hypothetical protein